MTLIKFEPLRELETLHSQMQKYFDDFFTGKYSSTETFLPRVEIKDKENNLEVLAELPGVSKENIKLKLEENVLTLEGEKKNENIEKGDKFYRSERVYGKFKRSFALPAEVESDNVEANFENGVLKVTLSKAKVQPKTEREISIK